jgi:hypothetical protein
MAQSSPGPCPICNTDSTLTPIDLPTPYNPAHIYPCDRVECPRCGPYDIWDTAKTAIQSAFRMSPAEVKVYAKYTIPLVYNDLTDLCVMVAQKGVDKAPSIISHVLRKSMTKSVIRPAELFDILKNNSLPTPGELANNLILFLGNRLSGPGDIYNIIILNTGNTHRIFGLIGTHIRTERADLDFIINELNYQRLLDPNVKSNGLRLTLSGWYKYDELRRSIKDSRRAFVAMDFYDPEKDGVDYFFQTELLYNYLRPEALKIGWELSNPLSSDPKAGNLHARLEVEIRSSRFVVAELSHHNNGAYWEAGFAKGLGKPVIYMYNREIGGRDKPHFDVGSDYIIFWEKDKPREAAEELNRIILATLFGEAKMTDD